TGTADVAAHQYFENLYNTPAQDTVFWTPPPGDPGTPVYLFNGTIYDRGVMTLQALRDKGRRRDVLRYHAGLGHREPLWQRDDTAVRRAGRARERPGPAALLRRLALPTRQTDLLVRGVDQFPCVWVGARWGHSPAVAASRTSSRSVAMSCRVVR